MLRRENGVLVTQLEVIGMAGIQGGKRTSFCIKRGGKYLDRQVAALPLLQASLLSVFIVYIGHCYLFVIGSLFLT